VVIVITLSLGHVKPPYDDDDHEVDYTVPRVPF